MIQSIVEDLKPKLSYPLPGAKAHQEMYFSGRDIVFSPPKHSMKAGVMLLLFPEQGETHLLYIRRKSIDGDVHKGQIGFPGGKMEEVDCEDLTQTALRESEEEVGIKIPSVNVIGSLSPLYIPVSNFQVFPSIGYVDYKPEFELQPSEIESILKIPLSYLSNKKIVGKKSITTSSGLVLKDVPYYDLFGDVLWGATAMITAEFLALLKI